MAQETLVLKLKPEEQRALKERLEEGVFEYRSVPHATFSVKGEGVIATLYSSGKLVVQGPDPQTFTVRYLEGAGTQATPKAPKAAAGGAALVPIGGPVLGSDEAGKGDYFGPLVVCALRLPAEHRDGVARSEVTDSKKLTDKSCLQMGPVLRDTFECAVEVLNPPEYNAAYAEAQNLNLMLADMHARAIRKIAQPGDVVLVDRFAAETLIASRLKGLDIDLYQKPRAEAEPAVAAASVIARAVFLEGLRELSEEAAVTLRKGAGTPTDEAARAYVEIHGFEALSKVAKVHFKNTSKIEAS